MTKQRVKLSEWEIAAIEVALAKMQHQWISDDEVLKQAKDHLSQLIDMIRSCDSATLYIDRK